MSQSPHRRPWRRGPIRGPGQQRIPPDGRWYPAADPAGQNTARTVRRVAADQTAVRYLRTVPAWSPILSDWWRGRCSVAFTRRRSGSARPSV